MESWMFLLSKVCQELQIVAGFQNCSFAFGLLHPCWKEILAAKRSWFSLARACCLQVRNLNQTLGFFESARGIRSPPQKKPLLCLLWAPLATALLAWEPHFWNCSSLTPRHETLRKSIRLKPVQSAVPWLEPLCGHNEVSLSEVITQSTLERQVLSVYSKDRGCLHKINSW